MRFTTVCAKRLVAEKWAKAKEEKLVGGESMLPRPGRVKYDEAVADLRSYYGTPGERNALEADWRFRHLAPLRMTLGTLATTVPWPYSRP